MKNFVFYLVIVLSVALGAVIGYFSVMQAVDAEMEMGSAIMYYIVGIVLCWYITLQMHETGHKFFGLFVGMDVTVKATRVFSSSLGCEIAPRYPGRNMRRRFIVTASGGLITNLALIILGAVFVFLPITVFNGRYIAMAMWLRCLLPPSFYIFFVNVFPFFYSAGKADGLVLQEAVRRDDSYQVAESILNIQGLINSGTRIQDIEEQMFFDMPQIREDDPYFVILTDLRYQYYKAVGNKEKEAFYKKRYDGIKHYIGKKN